MMAVSRLYLARVTPPEVARASVRSAHRRKGKALTGWQMNAMQRRKELQAIANYRVAAGIAIGPDVGWAMVIGNLFRVLHGHLTADDLRAETTALGRPPLDAPAIELAVQEISGKAWGRYRLYTSKQAGSAIELTSVEREEVGVTKIEAIDESTIERRRRQNRERMRGERAASAALRQPTKKAIAAMLGISLSKLKRDLRDGHLVIADTISVRTSYISPLSSKDPCTENGSHRSAHGKRVTREAS